MSDTIAYRYGAKPAVENGTLVVEQIRLARVYKNRLIELERARRQEVEKAVAEHGGAKLNAAEAVIAGLEAELGALREAASRKNAQSRSKSASAELRAKIAIIRSGLADARAKRKAMRQAIFADPHLLAVLGEIDAADLARRKSARDSCGVYWGTYLLIEDAMKDARKGAPPIFRRWDGRGSVGVQIQNGMSVDQLTGGTDTRLRLTDGMLSIRVGSGKGKSPIFATVPIVLDRPLPMEGRITWCRLTRRRVGTQDHWSVIFSVRGGTRTRSRTRPLKASAGSGAVGLDVGWRRVPGGLRVCCWQGSDGRHGELVLPDDLLSRWPKSESLRSIRDREFNAMRDELAGWLDTLPEKPQWLAEAISSPPRDDGSPRPTLRQWRSAERLGRLWWMWKDHRFAGDATIFEKMAAWRKQDRHLWNWAAHNVQRAIGRRKEIYRNFACMLRLGYATAYVEDVNWAKLNRVKEGPEDGALRENFRVAAVGGLIEAVKQAMRTVKTSAVDSTRECRHCGHVAAFDARSIHRVCPACQRVDDQDENAAAVILARGPKGEPPADAGPSGGDRPQTPDSDAPPPGSRSGRWGRLKQKKL